VLEHACETVTATLGPCRWSCCEHAAAAANSKLPRALPLALVEVGLSQLQRCLSPHPHISIRRPCAQRPCHNAETSLSPYFRTGVGGGAGGAAVLHQRWPAREKRAAGRRAAGAGALQHRCFPEVWNALARLQIASAGSSCGGGGRCGALKAVRQVAGVDHISIARQCLPTAGPTKSARQCSCHGAACQHLVQKYPK